VNPDHAVALGAAVQAGLKARDSALEEIRLTDVCPFTLGVDSGERDANGRFRLGLFSPIIERNTVLPTSRVQQFFTISDNQRQVKFDIYQGESRDVTANVKLGSISLPVPPRPAGQVQVDCRFSYDVSGLLEVDVAVPETGVREQLVIVDEDCGASTDSVELRRKVLAAMKIHPRDQAANAAAMARAERCYEALLGERRQYVGRLISSFQSVLDRQEARAIAQARKELEDALNQFEGERFL
jgi:molecular chaperone HscC